MALPFHTTTISVIRLETLDPYVDSPETTIASGVPAVISGLSGTEQGGDQKHKSNFNFACDPIPDETILHTDIILDEKTNIRYQVVWAQDYQTEFLPGLDHIEGDITIIKGSLPFGTFRDRPLR